MLRIEEEQQSQSLESLLLPHKVGAAHARETDKTVAGVDAISIVDRDAIAIGDLYRRARSSVVDSVRYLIDAGHRLIAKKDNMNHGEWYPWLATNADALGFDSPSTATRLMKTAKSCASARFDEAEAIRLNRIAWGHNVRGAGGTGENEWFTPKEYLDLARIVLGGIDLDPASSKQAQKIVKAERFYTKADSGLDHQWKGRVWLNPPYAQPLIADFVAKMMTERRAKRVTAGIMLTHNYTDTSWFHEAAGCANAICFTRGRVKFYEPDGEIAAPTQGQAFFYFGSSTIKFNRHFKEIGFVVQSI
jgi:phage N-6-adenine-methyltransferase